MATDLDRLAAEVEDLTEVKTPGQLTSDIANNGGEIKMAEQFRQDFGDDIKNVVIENSEDPASKTASPGEEKPNLTNFDASSYVEQGVIIADQLLQQLFRFLDKSTTLYQEDRQALDYLLYRTRNGEEIGKLDSYDQWLLAQGKRLEDNNEQRKMSETERENIVNALKSMPWITDRLMTPQSQLAWALTLYFSVRLVPIAFNLFNGKETPPAPPMPPEAELNRTEKPVMTEQKIEITTGSGLKLPNADNE